MSYCFNCGNKLTLLKTPYPKEVLYRCDISSCARRFIKSTQIEIHDEPATAFYMYEKAFGEEEVEEDEEMPLYSKIASHKNTYPGRFI